MIKNIRKILYLVDSDEKRKLPFMVGLFLFLSLVEIIGLGLIAPYISLVIDTEGLDKSLTDILSVFGSLQEKNSLIMLISIALLIIFFIKALLVILVNKIIIFFSLKQRVNISLFLMNAYQSLTYSVYLQRNSSEYIHNIQALTSIFSSAVLLLLRTTSSLIVSVFILSLLAWQNTFALILLLIIVGLVVISYDLFFKNKVDFYGKQSNIAMESMLKAINEGIEGLKEVRVLGKESFFYRIFFNGVSKHATYSGKNQVIQAIPRSLLEFLMVVFIVTLVLVALISGQDTQNIVPTLGLFGVAALRLIPAANTVSQALLQLRNNRDSINRLYQDVYKFRQNKDRVYSKRTKSNELFQSLTIDNIDFRYKGANHRSLKNVSINIKAGESIGLIGESGSGKTTMVDVVLGMLHPDKGKIYYNNAPLSEFLNQWRSQIAYIPQRILLLDNSLASNISLDIKSKTNKKKLMEVIDQSQLSELVSRLPQGLDTKIGERGVRISGGQRQRIALARAFYHDRSVLIMDEATSALDNETEKEIVKEIKKLKGQKTLIVIAHRLSTIEHCDRIYKLKDGCVVEEGTYQEVAN